MDNNNNDDQRSMQVQALKRIALSFTVSVVILVRILADDQIQQSQYYTLYMRSSLYYYLYRRRFPIYGRNSKPWGNAFRNIGRNGAWSVRPNNWDVRWKNCWVKLDWQTGQTFSRGARHYQGVDSSGAERSRLAHCGTAAIVEYHGVTHGATH